jgi:uncharacterized protein with HEPN domain
MPPEDRVCILHMIDIDRDILWKTVSGELPALLPQLRALVGGA